MAYASIEDMRLAIGEDTLRAIADHDGDREADDDVVTRALEEASALIDTYLPGELLPFIPSPAPIALRRAAIDLAGTYLRQPRDQSTDDSRAAYAATVRWLEGIAKGTTQLVGVIVPPGVEGIMDPGDPEVDGLARIWSRESARRVF